MLFYFNVFTISKQWNYSSKRGRFILKSVYHVTRLMFSFVSLVCIHCTDFVKRYIIFYHLEVLLLCYCVLSNYVVSAFNLYVFGLIVQSVLELTTTWHHKLHVYKRAWTIELRVSLSVLFHLFWWFARRSWSSTTRLCHQDIA